MIRCVHETKIVSITEAKQQSNSAPTQLINWYCLFDVVIAHITFYYWMGFGVESERITREERRRRKKNTRAQTTTSLLIEKEKRARTSHKRALHKLGIYIVIRTVVCANLNLQLNLWFCWGLLTAFVCVCVRMCTYIVKVIVAFAHFYLIFYFFRYLSLISCVRLFTMLQPSNSICCLCFDCSV